MDPEAGLREPLDRGVERRLRRAVLDHALGESRRRYLPLLHVGWPGHGEATFVVDPDEPADHALRADVVAAMARRVHAPGDAASEASAGAALVWLTRPGDLDVQDVDAAWLAAARQAYGEAGDPLDFVVVNRHGWLDPRTGVHRRWRRIRPRSGPYKQ